jgi:uncharacterized protein (DUF2141 family)
MKTTIFTIALATFTQFSFAVTFEVKGLRNTNGNVICYLYSSEIGFPTEPNKATRKVSSEISADKTSRCHFDDISLFKEKVAVSVLHDEDKNGEMRTNIIGIPKEGWAASNNAEAQTFGPPTFEDAKFDPQIIKNQTLKMNY